MVFGFVDFIEECIVLFDCFWPVCLDSHGKFIVGNTYLNIIYLPSAGELTVFAAALGGSCLGFLWFNASPAQIFMGDTGSLSTGAAIGTLSILLKKELILVILGGVFVIEALSVMIQVGYFHLSKILYGESRRFFLQK